MHGLTLHPLPPPPFNDAAEVPILFCSNAILRALGTENTLHLVVAAFVLRLMAYSTLAAWPSIWLVLPVECLHGITFGCAWSAGTSKSADLAPQGLGASMQVSGVPFYETNAAVDVDISYYNRILSVN